MIKKILPGFIGILLILGCTKKESGLAPEPVIPLKPDTGALVKMYAYVKSYNKGVPLNDSIFWESIDYNDDGGIRQHIYQLDRHALFVENIIMQEDYQYAGGNLASMVKTYKNINNNVVVYYSYADGLLRESIENWSGKLQEKRTNTYNAGRQLVKTSILSEGGFTEIDSLVYQDSLLYKTMRLSNFSSYEHIYAYDEHNNIVSDTYNHLVESYTHTGQRWKYTYTAGGKIAQVILSYNFPGQRLYFEKDTYEYDHNNKVKFNRLQVAWDNENSYQTLRDIYYTYTYKP